MEKVALVTGSSSGIGYETSLALAREGYFTYATMRDLKKEAVIKKIAEEENLPLKVIELDVDNDDSCLLYTSPSPRDQRGSRMPSSA